MNIASAMAKSAAIYTLPSLLAGSQEFDYIIVGGGTAGLHLATRLSEDPDVAVVILEAGEAKLNDQAIMTPAMFPTLIGNPGYDWMMKTMPQVCLPLHIVVSPC
jgi:choline dehydrogenase-like flavoprotein